MYGDWLFLCKFCEGKCLERTVLLLWTNSFCYKPSKINQSHGFYQFTARGTDCRLIKSLVSSNRNWKTEFFLCLRFLGWEPDGRYRDTFAPYTGDLRNLRPEGMPLPFFSFLFPLFYLLFIYV